MPETYEVKLSNGQTVRVTTEGGPPSEDQIFDYLERDLGRRPDESWLANLGRGASRVLTNPKEFAGNVVSGVGDAAKGLVNLGDFAAKGAANMLMGGALNPVTGPYDLSSDPMAQAAGGALADPLGTLKGVGQDYSDAYLTNPGKTLFEQPVRVAADMGSTVSPALKAGAAVAGPGRLGNALQVASQVANPAEGLTNVAKAVASRVGPKLEAGATKAGRMSLGASAADYYQKPAVQRAVQTQLQERLYPTASGLRKTDSLLDAVQGEKANLFAQNPNLQVSTATPNADAVVQRLQGVDAAGAAPLRQASQVLDEFKFGTNTSAPTFTTQQVPSGLLGPNGQALMTTQQVPAGRATLPTIDLTTQEAIKNELGARLNPAFSKGQTVPFEPGSVEAGKALYGDMRLNQEAALPPVIPLNQRATGLHNFKAQLLKGPLAQQEQALGNWPTLRGQVANAIRQTFGRGEAFAAHRMQSGANAANSFGASQTVLPQVLAPAVAADQELIERPLDRIRRLAGLQ